MLAGGQVDGSSLGIRGQNGATEFLQRFALRPHGAYDSVAAMRFAMEHQNPLVTGAVAGTETSPYPATTYSLLTLSDPGVLLWAVKPAEEGIEKGVIVRLWNVSDHVVQTTLSMTRGLTAGHRTTHIETNQEAIPLTATGGLTARFTRQQMQTYRLQLKPNTP